MHRHIIHMGILVTPRDCIHNATQSWLTRFEPRGLASTAPENKWKVNHAQSYKGKKNRNKDTVA